MTKSSVDFLQEIKDGGYGLEGGVSQWKSRMKKNEYFASLRQTGVRTSCSLLCKTAAIGAVLCISVWTTSRFAHTETSDEGIKLNDIRENLYAGAMLSNNVYMMVGERGKIYRSEDRGGSWDTIPTGTKEALFSIASPDGENAWICGNHGVILRTADGGRSWRKQSSGTENDLFYVDFGDRRHGVAVGDWGSVIFTNDGGQSWNDVSLAEDVMLYAVCMQDRRTGWIAGEFGEIFVTTDGGRSWESCREGRGSVEQALQANGLAQERKSVFCLAFDQGRLFAAGMDGFIAYSDDQGKKWSQAANASKEAIYAIAIKGETGWAVGALGTALYSRDRGESWRKVDLPMQFMLSWIGSVCLTKSANETKGFAVGSNGLLIEIQNEKIIW